MQFTPTAAIDAEAVTVAIASSSGPAVGEMRAVAQRERAPRGHGVAEPRERLDESLGFEARRDRLDREQVGSGLHEGFQPREMEVGQRLP